MAMRLVVTTTEVTQSATHFVEPPTSRRPRQCGSAGDVLISNEGGKWKWLPRRRPRRSRLRRRRPRRRSNNFFKSVVSFAPGFCGAPAL